MMKKLVALKWHHQLKIPMEWEPKQWQAAFFPRQIIDIWSYDGLRCSLGRGPR